MASSVHYSPAAATSLSLDELEVEIQGWILENERNMRSKTTVANRRIYTRKLLWFMREKGFTRCGVPELRALFAYLVIGHETPEGRWNNASRANGHHAKQPMKASSVKAWYRELTAFFNFCVEDEAIAASPMEKIRPPDAREDQIEPFSEAQTEALIAAARKTRQAKRDVALVLFLLDTGARASEVCGMKRKDLDLDERTCRLHGKGGKDRTVHYGRETAHALWLYLRMRRPEPEEAVFSSERAEFPGEPMGRNGLLALIHRLGEAAGIEQVRCSPHTLRHTCAVRFLNDGGGVLALQQLLGHSSVTQTEKYVKFSQADLAQQHRIHSPVDSLLRKRKP